MGEENPDQSGLISIIPLIRSFVVYDYMIEIARRVFESPEIGELPEWDDFGGYLSRRFLFWLRLAIWVLPFVLLFACGVLLAILFGVAAGEEAFVGIFGVLLLPRDDAAILLLSLAAGLAIPVLLGRFAIHGRFGAMFEFGEIITEIRLGSDRCHCCWLLSLTLWPVRSGRSEFFSALSASSLPVSTGIWRSVMPRDRFIGWQGTASR
ncbi:MAG: DUF4013 domain-containing protein [Thermomicrobiales bacterium]